MDEKVIVGKETDYPLDGILSMPNESQHKFPAVVLVHGSGPSDKDETIMANKPFRDIAEYLSAKGIAVLRYDKRTKIYGKKMIKQKNSGSMSVKDETIEDTILAANLLRSDIRIDHDKVFVIGHSLGGMLAPRIDAEGGNFAGIIIMAGSPRNLSEIMLSQNEELIGQLNKILQKLAVKQIASLKAKFDAISVMSDDRAQNKKILGNIYAWYFKEMEEHPAINYLKATSKPILILQGDKDFHVSVEKDFILYQQLLAGKGNVSFKLYPGLNHMFMKSVYGTIKEFKKEYKIPSKVDFHVLEDIAEWILSH